MPLRIQEMCGADAVLLREIPPGSGNYVADNGTTLMPFSSTQKASVSYDDTVGNLAISPTAGTALLTKDAAGVDYTLAAPIAGPFPVGQDGLDLSIVSNSAFAHVVTGPDASINGMHVMTFAPTIGSSVVLHAVNGAWVTKSVNGVVLS